MSMREERVRQARVREAAIKQRVRDLNEQIRALYRQRDKLVRDWVTADDPEIEQEAAVNEQYRRPYDPAVPGAASNATGFQQRF